MSQGASAVVGREKCPPSSETSPGGGREDKSLRLVPGHRCVFGYFSVVNISRAGMSDFFLQLLRSKTAR